MVELLFYRFFWIYLNKQTPSGLDLKKKNSNSQALIYLTNKTRTVIEKRNSSCRTFVEK